MLLVWPGELLTAMSAHPVAVRNISRTLSATAGFPLTVLARSDGLSKFRKARDTAKDATNSFRAVQDLHKTALSQLLNLLRELQRRGRKPTHGSLC